MEEWHALADYIKTLLIAKSLKEARDEIQVALERFPAKLDLLVVATDVYRALGEPEKSLKYAELIVIHYPERWNGYVRASQDLIALKRFDAARKKIQTGLEKIPNQLNLLTIAANLCRASGDRETALKYAELLIAHHPENWSGYGRAAQDLFYLNRVKAAHQKIRLGLEKFPNNAELQVISAVFLIAHQPENPAGYVRAGQGLIALNRFAEAEKQIQAGLSKIPNQITLLAIAHDFYRGAGDRDKSLEYAELMITHHPANWNGYGRAAKDLIAVKRFDDAVKRIQAGLRKIPNQVDLLIIAINVYRVLGDREKSLECAELLMTHYPEYWNGYGRSAEDLIALKRFEQAQGRIAMGLEQLPNHVNLLAIATEVYRSSGDQRPSLYVSNNSMGGREKSLEYAELLIAHHPQNWIGYGRAAQDLVALKRFKEAQEKLDAGIAKTTSNVNILTIAADLYSEMGDPEKSFQYAKTISEDYEGMNKGCPYVLRQLIKNLRNRRNVAEDWELFCSIMQTVTGDMLSGFDLKWLISVCDTFADHCNGERGAMALTISMFVGSLRIAETMRLMHKSECGDPKNVPHQKLYDGVSSVHLKIEDTYLNIGRRMKWVLRSDPLMTSIWIEVLSRVHANSAVIQELLDASEFPERYFPCDPTGIEDNYGLKYEQLYQE